jgi:hypothetical protein
MTNFLHASRPTRELLKNRQRLPVLAYCIKYVKRFGRIFRSLPRRAVEHLVAPYTSVSMHMPDPASSPKVDGLEEETRPGEVQTEVGRRDYTVRQF